MSSTFDWGSAADWATAVISLGALVAAALAYDHTKKTNFAQVLRPRLRVRAVQVTGGRGSLEVVNYGSSRATIKASGCFLMQARTLPPHPGHIRPNNFVQAKTIARGSGSREYFVDVDPRGFIGPRTFVWGWISFCDDDGVLRHLDFCFEREQNGEAFKEAEASDYIFAG